MLNALLSIINERVFHNDGAPVRCPLVSLFAASNELPEGKELEALCDRCLLPFDVGYLLVPCPSTTSGTRCRCRSRWRQVGDKSAETNNAESGFDT